MLNLSTNYSLEVEDVYRNVAVEILLKNLDFDLLCVTKLPFYQYRADLPSWVPDCSCESDMTWLPGLYRMRWEDYDCQLACAKDSKFLPRLDGGILHLEGQVLAHVHSMGRTMNQQSSDTKDLDVIKSWAKIRGCAPERSIQQENPC
jgi:hypothetical protein